ncbi:MAG: hypothetical protein ACLFPM_03315 [Candidatus Izemoplasmatales bacterium]
MICQLCKQFFLDEDSIIGLFKFSEICHGCLEKYRPKQSFEVIPIHKGLIEYYYLYEDINLSQKQKKYLSKHLALLYTYLINHKEVYDLFIYLDDSIYYHSNNFGDYINNFSCVFIFSLERKEVLFKDMF